MELEKMSLDKRILLVEDESVIALSIEETLNNIGYTNVDVALSPDTAIAKLDGDPFDLAILDINLNDQMDGIEVARKIKEKNDTPIIFLTGNSDQLTVSRAKYAEPSAFLVKPFEEKDLRINLELIFYQQTADSTKTKKSDQLKLTHHFFNNNPYLIIRMSVSREILYVNPMITRVTGQAPGFYSGKALYNADFPPEFITQMEQPIDNVLKKNRKTSLDMNIPTIMGERMMNAVFIPESIDGKNIYSVAIIFQDITDQKISSLDLINKNKKIVDSINYSKRLQDALLPDDVRLRQYFPDSFILLKPKDIVSGDFPWIFCKNEYLFVAAVDCTGHGVPGALMSLITHFLLNEIIRGNSNLLPSRILDILHVYVKKSLKQHFSNVESRDGADIALCRVNMNTGQLDYAGAHRPMLHMRKGEITEIKGDKQPIGGMQYTRHKRRLRFTNQELCLEPGDRIYMFSDGLTDQFGGPEKTPEKYGIQRAKDAFKQSLELSCMEAAVSVLTDFNNWKGNQKQLDDMLVIGFTY